MKKHKHRKHIKTINTVIESCLLIILIVLVAIMMVLIGKLQGTARVINYTGLVRGATQREVKLDITGNPNDELIDYLDGILEDLKYEDGDYNLVKLDDNDYEKKLDTQIAFWILLKNEIYKVREYGYENTDIVNLSEEYFQLADQTVSAAEKYSERIADNIRLFETFTAIDMVIIIIYIIEKKNNIRFHKNTGIPKYYILRDVQRGHPMIFSIQNDSPVICLPLHNRRANVQKPVLIQLTSVLHPYVSHCYVG